MESLRGNCYKLCMMGVPINGPSLVQVDNMSVILNLTRPQSTLTKKSNSICYHTVHEAVAMNEFLLGQISTHDNCSDLLKKWPMMEIEWNKLVELCGICMIRVYTHQDRAVWIGLTLRGLFRFTRIQESWDTLERWDVLHTNVEKNESQTQLPTAGACWHVLQLLLVREDQTSPSPCVFTITQYRTDE